ncbi:CPBP family intramembrane glutamic endopeptidase [Tepidibacter thalassicus]|uniref:CAAX prenyl protease 2/Lysostaphin resistance protein A-like domain-containing protein n=1 Tax=Tepidibacter thalassicus DSM 15285 TaxID=1123350 RepID=A0A1M5TVN5_9FIRM|nr:CPBP family intramembrane glutamic endopeptidase [Tepidibacter thalassicus]SHH54721.1 hypothetical protein SAMN02744040_02312 [Tepidibacter thalassicus DSM 15285]
MKKYLSMTGNIIKYYLIYFIITFISQFSIGIIYGIKYYKTLPKSKIVQLIMNNLYLTTGIASIITFFVYILLFKNKEQNLYQRCKFKKISSNNIISIILISIIISFTSSNIAIFMSTIFESYKKVSKILLTGVSSPLNALCILLILPAFEEILFRGLIFNELKKNINITASIIIQSLIFAICHGNIVQGIYTFLMGIILALIYNFTNSIYAPILLHITYNILGTMVFPKILKYPAKYSILFILIGLVCLVFTLLRFYSKQNNFIKENNLY